MRRINRSAKVVLISPSLEDGGVETYLRTLSAGMIVRGHPVSVYLPEASSLDSLRSDLRNGGATVESFGYKWRSPRNSRQVVAQIARDFTSTLRAISRTGTAKVIVMLPHPELSPGMVLAASFARRDSIAVVHLVPPDLQITAARRFLYSLVRRSGQRWVCVSDHNAQVLVKALGWARTDVETVQNGVPLRAWPAQESRRMAARELRQSLGLPSDARIILSVGRLNLQKGHDLIVDGMPDVLSEIPDAYWLWAGDGAERDALLSRARVLGVGHRLILLGRLDSVDDLLLGSDVLLFPSRYEGFALTPLEAQMAGLPVIVSDAGSLPQMVRPGIDGAVVRSNDPAAIAKETIAVLKMPEMARARAREAGRRVRAEFTSDRVTDQMVRLAFRGKLPPLPNSGDDALAVQGSSA